MDTTEAVKLVCETEDLEGAGVFSKRETAAQMVQDYATAQNHDSTCSQMSNSPTMFMCFFCFTLLIVIVVTVHS